MKGPRFTGEAGSGQAVRNSLPQPDLTVLARYPGDSCPICYRPGTVHSLYGVNNVGHLPIFVCVDFMACERCAGNLKREYPPAVRRLRRKLQTFTLEAADKAVDELILEQGEKRGAA